MSSRNAGWATNNLASIEACDHIPGSLVVYDRYPKTDTDTDTDADAKKSPIPMPMPIPILEFRIPT